jgi:hypothetical protein
VLLGHAEVGTRKVGDDDDVFFFKKKKLYIYIYINVSVLCVIYASVGNDRVRAWLGRFA